MALNFKTIWSGLKIKAKAVLTSNTLGEIETSSVTNKTYLHNGTISSPILTEASAAVITNKDLVDSTTNIVDSVDATKRINFDAAGTTGTRTTLASSQTTNKTLTLPDATDTLIGKATTDTLTNKTLSDTTTVIADSVDPSIQVKIDAAGTTSTSTTITSSQTVNRVLTLPDATDTLVGKATTDTLTNKTIDANGTGNSISNLETADLATGVLNTSITLALASDTQVPSALAVKTYVDNKAAAQNEASEITYINTTSGLLAANVQTAIDEVDFDLDAVQLILGDHIADTTDAHDASAISNIPAGTIVATDVQAALNELDGDIQGHITDLVDAHDASAISSIASGNLIATDVQSALNELQTDVDTRATSTALTDHINDTTDAHDASAISSVASGNLAATDVQAALNELQSDIDTRALTTGGSIITPVRLDMKQGTLASLTTYAITATDGQLVFATDTEESFVVNNGLLEPVGGGGISAWITAEAYVIDDKIEINNRLYKCLIAHTSGVFATDLAALKWVRLDNQADDLLGVVPTVNGGTGLSTVGTESQVLKVVNGVPAYADTPNTFKNYITATDGKTIGAWVTYADAAGTNPVDGTGGVATATYAVSTNSDLRGTTNFLFTHTAANNQGNGFSYDFTIEPADKTKVLQISFDYMVASGTYADDDLQFWIYDVTNATLIQPAPFKLKNSGIIEKFALEFQASTSSSYRLIGHVATATATAYTLRFTNWRLGQQQKTYGSAVTDPISYTPTFTGFGTVSVSNCTYSIEGAFVNIECTFTSGTTTAVEARVSLPAGHTSTSTLPPLQVVGSGYSAGFSASGHLNSTQVLIEPSVNYVTFSAASVAGLAKSTGSGGFGSSSPISFKAKVPIAGWSSSQIMSNDADTRVVASAASATSTSVSTATPNITFTTTNINTNGAFDGTAYTVKTPGLYRLNTNFLSASVAWSATHQLIAYYNINGGSNNEIGRTIAQVTGTYIMDVRGYALLELKAGDVLRVALYSAVTQTPIIAKFSIERISGPSQIAASESVSFSANTSTTAATTSAPFIYTVKDHDTHNAYSTVTGKFTAPMSGKYHFDAIYYAGATAVIGGFYKQGVQVSSANSSVANTNAGAYGINISMLTGETMEIRPHTNATASGTSLFNQFSGFRMGN